MKIVTTSKGVYRKGKLVYIRLINRITTDDYEDLVVNEKHIERTATETRVKDWIFLKGDEDYIRNDSLEDKEQIFTYAAKFEIPKGTGKDHTIGEIYTYRRRDFYSGETEYVHEEIYRY